MSDNNNNHNNNTATPLTDAQLNTRGLFGLLSLPPLLFLSLFSHPFFSFHGYRPFATPFRDSSWDITDAL